MDIKKAIPLSTEHERLCLDAKTQLWINWQNYLWAYEGHKKLVWLANENGIVQPANIHQLFLDEVLNYNWRAGIREPNWDSPSCQMKRKWVSVFSSTLPLAPATKAWFSADTAWTTHTPCCRWPAGMILIIYLQLEQNFTVLASPQRSLK